MLNTILCTIAMMNIKIYNRHTLEAIISRTSICSSNRHIVKQTETLRDVIVIRIVKRSMSSNMMTRRTHTAEDGGRTCLGIGRREIVDS